MGHSQGLSLIGGCVCVCVYECVCVCACLRPWEGWLCKPKLALPMPQSLSEMKDDGKTEPRSKGGYSPVILRRTNAHPTVAQRLWYMIQPHLLAFFCYKICTLTAPSAQRATRKQSARCLSWGRAASNCYWRRWPTVNRLQSLRLNSWLVQVVYAECVCSLYPTQAELLVRMKQQTEVEFTDKQWE